MATSGLPLPKYLEDAFVLMEMNLPKHPTKLIEELGAYQGDGHARHWHGQARPHFKGWAGTVNGMTRYSTDMGLYPEDLTDINYFGLWVGVTALRQVIYCAIPSMETGSAQPGQTVEMGKERVKIGQYTEEELDGFVVLGWNKMQQMIEKCGAYIPKLKVSSLPQA